MKKSLIQAGVIVLIATYVVFVGAAIWALFTSSQPPQPTAEPTIGEVAEFLAEPVREALEPVQVMATRAVASAIEAKKAARRAQASAEATWEVAYEAAYADIEQDVTESAVEDLEYQIEYYADVFRKHEISHFKESDKPAFTDLVQTSLKGVVHIKCPYWQGSGFVAGPRLIVTARHCVEGVEDFLITTNDGHQVRATRAISDKKHDVAFIRIDDLECVAMERGTGEHDVVLSPLTTGSIKDCVLGQPVYVIGSPYGKVNFNSLTTGVISGVDVDWSPLGEDYGWKVAFTVDSAGHPGNSGCPVFTTDGVVRGILVGGFSPVLISVMPCDLFLADLDSIRLMFTQDRYAREETPEYDDWRYGSVIEERDER